jgi:hypothetical protein
MGTEPYFPAPPIPYAILLTSVNQQKETRKNGDGAQFSRKAVPNPPNIHFRDAVARSRCPVERA